LDLIESNYYIRSLLSIQINQVDTNKEQKVKINLTFLLACTLH